MSAPTALRVVTFRDGEMWLAQCLEHDVCVQANDLQTLRVRMEIAMKAEDDFENLPPAPKKFFALWDKRSLFDADGHADGIEYTMALVA